MSQKYNVYMTARVLVKAVITADNEYQAAKIAHDKINFHLLDEECVYSGLEQYYLSHGPGYVELSEFQDLEDAYRIETVESVRVGSDIGRRSFSHENYAVTEIPERGTEFKW